MFRLYSATKHNFSKDQLWRDSEQAWGSCQPPYSRKPAPPSALCRLQTQPEQLSRSIKEGKKGKREKGGIGGVYSLSCIDDSNIPPASKSPHWGKSSTGNPLVWNPDMRLCAQNKVHARWQYTQQIKWTCSSQDGDQSPKVQTQLQVRWWVGSLSRPSRGVPFPAWYQSQH